MEIYAAHLIPMPNGLSFSATIKCSELCQARLLNKFCMWLIKPDSRRYKKKLKPGETCQKGPSGNKN